jgi:hypothetical protein
MRGPTSGSVVYTKCKKIYHGGINHPKYHLASITHCDAKPCPKATEEIKREMNALIAVAEQK